MRAPTSRWSTAASAYVAAARPKARRTARGSSASPSTARSCGSSRSERSACHRGIRRAAARTRPGATGTERAPAPAIETRRAFGSARGEPRAGGRRRERVALAGDHQRRLRDRRHVGAQIGGRQDGERRRRARTARDRRARTGRGASVASVARPSALPASCSDRKRCSVSRYDARSSSPNCASVCLAIACGQSSRATKHGVVATSTSRAIRSGARARPAQRHGAAERPADDGERLGRRVERRARRHSVSASSVQGATGSL